MKKHCKKLAVYLISGSLLVSTFTVIPGTPFSIEAEAHSGRTDANGGHKDNKNKSGLGSYHYHCGGHPAHLHPNGVCPYQSGNASEDKQTSKQAEQKPAAQPETKAETQPETQAAAIGWYQDASGWYYCKGENQYCKDGWQEIDSKWYYFDANGYMKTGWLILGDDWYYLASDGHMVTGDMEIDGTLYYFETNGVLTDDYYD